MSLWFVFGGNLSPSAEEALMHPWFEQEYELEPYVLA
jgi:hypothetical protein